MEAPVALRMTGFLTGDGDVSWVLWIEEDGQGHRFDRLYTGRVKLQDESVATAYCVFDDATQKLQAALGGWYTPPLF